MLHGHVSVHALDPHCLNAVLGLEVDYVLIATDRTHLPGSEGEVVSSGEGGIEVIYKLR